MMNLEQIRAVAEELPADVLQAGRQVWLAGLGAAGIVTARGQEAFSRLVAEGRRMKGLDVNAVVDQVERTVEQVVDTAVEPLRGAARSLDETVQATTRQMLARLGVPSRQEVAQLTTRVEQLIEKVESLNRRKRAVRARKASRRAH